VLSSGGGLVGVVVVSGWWWWLEVMRWCSGCEVLLWWRLDPALPVGD
jgi:hypothetical protein